MFAFATTLTRLTSVLAHKSPDVAIQQATEQVADRFGGTRIASNIRALIAARHGGAVRGAIVIIASDGWDSEPAAGAGQGHGEVAPYGVPGALVEPEGGGTRTSLRLVGAMAAALPYCDDVLPAHNVRALADVVSAIVRAGRSDVVSSRG